MVEHVRRRALMADNLERVIVATDDPEIEKAVRRGGGEVIRTTQQHDNGTSRVAEVVANIECDFVVLLQGDEPLLLPSHVEALLSAITNDPGADFWNVTCPINVPDELDRHSFVKCAVGSDGRILYCFRRSPSHVEFAHQTKYIRKILGLFAFRRSVLLDLAATSPTPIEQAEFIEQMRLIETGRRLISVPVDRALPSVNEPHEAEIVLEELDRDPEQKELLNLVLAQGI